MPEFLYDPATAAEARKFVVRPNDEAANFISSKPAVPRAVFDRMLPELKARAFTVAGLETATAMQNVRDLVADLPRGGDWDTLKRQIAGHLAFSIDDAADPETRASQAAAADRKAELLLRMHGFQAYSAGAFNALDAQREVFPFWQYKSMGDGRVRHTHRALHDLILPADDPFWRGHFPPWEWGCRCQLVGRQQEDIDEIREEDKDKAPELRRIVEGEAHKQLLEHGRLVRGLNEIYDVRTPVQKGVKGAFSWDPADLRISLQDLRSRYDDDVWGAFEGWARATEIPDAGKTVWDWLSGITAQDDAAWPALASLRQAGRLGGSTGALLMEDARGRRYVLKRGNSAAHIREEYAADQLYAALGVPVPRSTLIETAAGPVKLAEFVEGESLAKYLARAKPAEAEAVLARIRENFAADALLGNWDVAGAELDNILVAADGTPWRIDNGGSLRFRAMGAAKTSAEWGAKVLELDSLRDPNRNPQTARIFRGITEDGIRAQIVTLLDKRTAILEAAPADVASMLAARLDDLALRLAPAGEITEIFAQEVRKSRILGRTYLGDYEHIEDHALLFWQEKNAQGEPVTMAKLRFTPEGYAAIRAKLGGVLTFAPAAQAGPQPHPGDAFWPSLQAALKTVNHHQSDGNYNPATMAKLEATKQLLAAFQPADQDGQAMKAAYENVVASIDKAVAGKTGTTIHTQYLVKPKPVKTKKPADILTRIRGAVSTLTYKAKSRLRGFATEKDGVVKTVSGAYQVTLDDVEVTFAPWEKGTAYAHRGVATIRIPGEATPENMRRAITTLGEMGVDARPTPGETGELLYLRKTLAFAAPDGDWQDLLKGDQPAAEKLAALKAWTKDKLGIDVAAHAAYLPAGQANGWGDGWRTWDRFDLPPATIEKELKGYGLTHRVAGSIPDFIGSILDGGGQVTSTMERMRVGIGVSQGMSPDADQGTGGANYFFTRIASPKRVAGHYGLVFKIGRLSRADAFSFSGDYFGDVRPAGENTHTSDPRKSRGKTVADYRTFSKNSSNETIFKNGLSLLDDIQHIRTTSAKERELVIDIFARHGITALPDGRQISEIVQ